MKTSLSKRNVWMPMLAVIIAVSGAFASKLVKANQETRYETVSGSTPQCVARECSDTDNSNGYCGILENLHLNPASSTESPCQDPIDEFIYKP